MFHYSINHPKNRLNWLRLMVNSQFLVANLPSDCWMVQAECAVESPVSLRRPHLVGFLRSGIMGYTPNEIAIKSRDNDQQNHKGCRGTRHFQTNPIVVHFWMILWWYCWPNNLRDDTEHILMLLIYWFLTVFWDDTAQCIFFSGLKPPARLWRWWWWRWWRWLLCLSPFITMLYFSYYILLCDIMLYNDVSYTMLYNIIQCCIMLYNLYNVT